MIQKMNKYAFLIFHQEYEGFLDYLQSLGVVHITEKSRPQEVAALQAITEERLRVVTLLKTLRAWLPEDFVPDALGVVPQEEGLSAVAWAERVIEAYTRKKEQVETLRARLREQEVWGEFDPSYMDLLAQQGLNVVGYVVPAPTFSEEYSTANGCIEVEKRGRQQYFVRVEMAGDMPCPGAERVALPQERLSEAIQTLKDQETSLVEEEQKLKAEVISITHALTAYDAELEDRFSYGAARLQGEPKADNRLIFLEGWLPAEQAQELEGHLKQSGYYYQECPITGDDQVPISLKNSAFARGFEVITRMFSLPNYGEIDQTVLFAPFFMLFFGLCLGDAGYGLLVFLAATYYKYKTRGTGTTDLCNFMQWLGGAAFVVGLLTGSLFGVVLPYASGEDYILNQDNLMLLSIVLGLIQIFFAKGVAAYKTKIQRGMKYALAPFAWIVLLLTLGLLVGLPHLSIVLPSIVHYVLYGVVGLTALVVLFYNSPGEHLFSNVGSALWAAYNTASGLLGDTLSYIRLFAIGLTGAILGGVFNSLAIDTTEGLNPFLRFPIMLLILLLGHGINFAIAIIGALVHPIRLTFVEYYKNSEFEGGGKAYSPFKRVRK